MVESNHPIKLAKKIIVGSTLLLVIGIVVAVISMRGTSTTTPTRSSGSLGPSQRVQPPLETASTAAESQPPPAGDTKPRIVLQAPAPNSVISNQPPDADDVLPSDEEATSESQSMLAEKATMGTAKMTIGGKAFSLPNHGGHYERALIAKNDTVHIDVLVPPNETSTMVFAHAIQGGKINGNSAEHFDISQNKTISFDFKPSAEPGLYEVLLRRGTHEEVLQFWVSTNHPESDPAISIRP